ncbi:putative 3-mercaptopyruvate sulfurtransferase [Tenacibaculum maritimum]|uniref:sulfurtransferase n=1 Tax=Tenacibaculum maritimum TaxID=107401 RepID=UPI0012E52B60|nr:sulfurtransferase [Tenacibaculum maritimum]CAA0221064.1 putative 3-mercaptopyruvate sulfurtransferase [Tenacibaculum maritimum]
MELRVHKAIVFVDWLYENMENQNLVILNATIKKIGSKDDFKEEEKQIKGALFFDLKTIFSDQNSPLPNTMLPPDKFEEESQKLGISKDSCIIVYDDLGTYSSPRVWWMFKVMGFENVAVLNGGFPEWKSKGFPTEDKKIITAKTRGNFTVNFQNKKIISTKELLTVLSVKDSLIIDARSSSRFKGEEPEPRKEVRSGHIPSAINLPYGLLQEGGLMKSSRQLEILFEKVNKEKVKMMFSCGSGITACILALGADIANYKNYGVYDGSWTEWGSNHKLPIEK